MNKRISGLDLARVFSIFGMMVVNYHYGFGAFQGSRALQEFANFFNGRASACFVVLAGIGLILFARKMREKPDDIDLANKAKRVILNRSILLFFIGTLDSIYWPADILRSYGAFFFIGSFCLAWRKNSYLLASAISIVLFTALYMIFDFSKDWNIAMFSYIGFWTPFGFIKSLFFNGWNPVLPWIGFFFWGMFLGVHILEEKKNEKTIIWMSLIVFSLLFLLSLNTEITKILNPPVIRNLYGQDSIFTVNQLPPLPMYYFLSISFANIVIILFLKIGYHFRDSKIVNAIAKIGTYSHTIYLFHIYIGMIVYLIFRNIPTEEIFYSMYGKESIEFMWVYTLLAFSILSLFCLLWSLKFAAGPLELFVKKVTEKNLI